MERDNLKALKGSSAASTATLSAADGSTRPEVGTGEAQSGMECGVGGGRALGCGRNAEGQPKEEEFVPRTLEVKGWRKGGKGEGEEEEGGGEATLVNCRDIVTDIASRCD